MHVVETSFTPKNGKTYKSTLIRESYREGKKVKKRTIANISHCSAEEVTAIKYALKHKKNWHEIGNIKEIKTKQGISFGATFVVYELIKKIGMKKVLSSFGNSEQAKLACWQIIARIVDQGSRLSAVRMARDEASDEILHFDHSFNEDDLYKNLAWLGDNQAKIEQRLFSSRMGKEKPILFLYDVTSSYLEGMCNELSEWGYNRDKKKGKKQIVIGLLCDSEGVPVSIEVFSGNTNDTATFVHQVKKVSNRFNCQKVTFVGDKGMIKSVQIKDLNDANFHYITSITKPQIKKLVKTGVFQLSLFEDNLVEVEHENVRYILRRNPLRADEIKQNSTEKQDKIVELIEKQNEYLKDHPRAKEVVALKKVENKISQLKLKKWTSVKIENRNMQIVIDKQAKEKEAEFDGCYCIKTDLDQKDVKTEQVHKRYKDLSKVEWAFRTSKTTHLEIRPLYVIKEKSTRGHMLVCMLAYMIEQELRKAWQEFDLTPAEGLKRLRSLCTTTIKTKDKKEFDQVPIPNRQTQNLLNSLNISLPHVIPKRRINVDTRKKIKS